VTQTNLQNDAKVMQTNLQNDAKVAQTNLRHDAKVMQEQLEAQLRSEMEDKARVADLAAAEQSKRDAKIESLLQTIEQLKESHAEEVSKLKGHSASTLRQTKQRLKADHQKLRSEMDRKLTELNEMKCASETTLDGRYRELMGQHRQLEQEREAQVLELQHLLEEVRREKDQLAEAMTMQVQRKDLETEALAARMTKMRVTQAAALGIAIDARLAPPTPWHPAPAQSSSDLRGPTSGSRLLRSSSVRGKLYADINGQIRSPQPSRSAPRLTRRAVSPGSPGTVMVGDWHSQKPFGKAEGGARS